MPEQTRRPIFSCAALDTKLFAHLSALDCLLDAGAWEEDGEERETEALLYDLISVLYENTMGRMRVFH